MCSFDEIIINADTLVALFENTVFIFIVNGS